MANINGKVLPVSLRDLTRMLHFINERRTYFNETKTWITKDHLDVYIDDRVARELMIKAMEDCITILNNLEKAVVKNYEGGIKT